MNFNFTLIAQALVFAALIAFTIRFVWPPLLRAIEARQKTIADGLAAAEQGRRSLETSTRQAEDAVNQARSVQPKSSPRRKSAPVRSSTRRATRRRKRATA